MKCAVCGRKAVLSSPSLCEFHLKVHMRKKVEEVLQRVKGISEKRILIAVSGGKDSSSLAHILKDFDFDKEMLHIDLGIPGYSERCLEAVKKLERDIRIKLNVVELAEYGFTIEDVQKAVESNQLREKVCSICGTVKRYIFNRFAWENGFDYVATAHNLDDVVALTAMGISSGNISYPIEPVSHPIQHLKLAGKLKPFFHIREREIMVYALINGIPFYHGECPYSTGNTQVIVKREITRLEAVLPNFGRNMVKIFRRIPREPPALKSCTLCGYATSSGSGICKFCRIQKSLISQG